LVFRLFTLALNKAKEATKVKFTSSSQRRYRVLFLICVSKSWETVMPTFLKLYIYYWQLPEREISTRNIYYMYLPENARKCHISVLQSWTKVVEKKDPFGSTSEFSVSNFDISTPSPLFNVVTR